MKDVLNHLAPVYIATLGGGSFIVGLYTPVPEGWWFLAAGMALSGFAGWLQGLAAREADAAVSRRCAFCGEVYGERECARCGRGMCDLCDFADDPRPKHRVRLCWDCRKGDK